MAIKIRNAVEAADQFIKEMADKPYGVNDRLERITISIEGTLFDKIDDVVRKRKRAKQENRTISALIREALEYYISKNKI
jgi:predicted DNA-binding protein